MHQTNAQNVARIGLAQSTSPILAHIKITSRSVNRADETM
jgi:hypothetical protein